MLGRLPHPADAQLLITERRKGVDGDEEEAELIEEQFREAISKAGYHSHERVHVPTKTAGRWVIEALGKRRGDMVTTDCGAKLRALIEANTGCRTSASTGAKPMVADSSSAARTHSVMVRCDTT